MGSYSHDSVTPMTMSMFKPYRFRLSAYGWTGDYTLYSMPEGWILVPDSEHLPARRLTEKHADQILRHSKYLGRGGA